MGGKMQSARTRRRIAQRRAKRAADVKEDKAIAASRVIREDQYFDPAVTKLVDPHTNVEYCATSRVDRKEE